MAELAAEKNERLSWVSANVPLISNLDVWANIALIRQYHENMAAAEARRLAEEYLRRYGLEGISSKRGPALTNEQRFCVMLLRAVMVRDAILIIDQPYKILIYSKADTYLDDTLKVIDDSFKECYIFDLTWNRDRYRTTNAS